LGKLGAVAQETIPTLIAIVRSPSSKSIVLPKGNPAESQRLMRRGIDAAKFAAANGIRVADDDLRIAAVHSLCNISKSDPRIQILLKDLSTDISPEVRSAAAQYVER
jgi:HEAT repeat protein